MKTYKPGEKADVSAQYRIVGTREERTVTKGEPLPPTPHRGERYVVSDKTKHKSGK